MILTCYYDLRYQPNTFDFAIFLAGANAYGELIKATSLAVKIICPEYRKVTEREILYDNDEKAWRTYNMLQRLPHLLPKLHSVTWSKEPPELVDLPCYPPPLIETQNKLYVSYSQEFQNNGYSNFHTFRFLKSKFFAFPEAMKPFVAPKHALALTKKKYGANFITISLRANRFQPLRNSNIESWKSACDYIVSKGFQPIIIPDFEDYFDEKSFEIIDHPIALEATFDLAVRMAMYQNAKYNLATNNGVVGLLLHSKIPYSVFKFIVPGVNNCTAAYLKANYNLNYGEQFWFMGPNQHLIWADDSIDFVMGHLKIILDNV